jgi:hypothetical protein
MSFLKITSYSISVVLLSGCASTSRTGSRARGPRLVSAGYTTPSGAYYAEVGVEFTTAGDYAALFSLQRWENPIKTGGTLSWMNPMAWNEDAGRTGRVLLGEAAVVGAAVAGYAIGSSMGDDGGDSSSGEPPPPTDPPDPPPDK